MKKIYIVERFTDAEFIINNKYHTNEEYDLSHLARMDLSPDALNLPCDYDWKFDSLEEAKAFFDNQTYGFSWIGNSLEYTAYELEEITIDEDGDYDNYVLIDAHIPSIQDDEE